MINSKEGLQSAGKHNASALLRQMQAFQLVDNAWENWEISKVFEQNHCKPTQPSGFKSRHLFISNSTGYEVEQQVYCLYAFNGELMCFVHVLLNGLDMVKKGKKAIIVIEGAAVKLVPELEKESCPFHALYNKAKAQGIIDGVCKACSAKLGVLDAVKDSRLPLLDNMSGHPSMVAYADKGYTIITF